MGGGGKEKNINDLLTGLTFPTFPWTEGLCLAGRAKRKRLLIDVINCISIGSLVNTRGGGGAGEGSCFSRRRLVGGHGRLRSLQWGGGILSQALLWELHFPLALKCI